MRDNSKYNLPLEPYRVLDLTEGGCMVGARFLGDMGADVIRIETPGGSASRIGPYYKNIPHPEKSLYWFAYNANKRGVTLDIAKPEGRDLLKRLVKMADIIIESFEPDYMKGLGLGYSDLCSIKPDIIMAAISPYGQEGPKAHYKGSDLTAWASGGYLYISGDPDRAPTWISFPQASLHAGVEATSGSLAALWHRNNTGEGQFVDVSVQECVIACDFNTPEMWDLNKINFTRFSGGINIGTRKGKVKIYHVFPCKDGYVHLIIQGGVQPFINSMNALVKWMDNEGMADDWLKAMDWGAGYDASKLTQDVVDRVEESAAKFLMTKTKMELYEDGALKRRIMLGIFATTKDVSENKQLKARDFWVPVEHPELGETLTYPKAPVRLLHSPVTYRRRAPLIGEHNAEIYEGELGLSRQELILLKQANVI